MGKLTIKYKKNNRTKTMKKHKVSKKSRKSRNKKIIHIKKNSRKRRRVGGGGDGDSDDELDNIESGKLPNYSGDPVDIESGRESMTPVRQRKNKILTARTQTQSPFVSIFSRSFDNLSKSISPFSRKLPSTSPNISSSSADSEEQLSGVVVHSNEYQNYLTNTNKKNYKALEPVVFESVKNQFSLFLDKLGYEGDKKEELMNKLTDPDFIHNLDTLMGKMSDTYKNNLNLREELFEATQQNALESIRKDIEDTIKKSKNKL